MRDDEKKEFKALIKDAVKEEIRPLYVDREQHFLDHEFLKGMREFRNAMKSATTKILLTTLITAISGLLLLGFIFWGKKHFD